MSATTSPSDTSPPDASPADASRRQPHTDPAQATPRAWALLVVVCGALFLEGIDIAMLNVATPEIGADLGLGDGDAHWVISAYVLGYAGFMLLGGRTADVLGRRRVFLSALGVFVAFSVAGGLAHAGWLLILARFTTGVAAAFLTPAGFSIVTTSFAEGPLRNRALAIYGAVGAGGFTLGTVAGGALTTAGWRWVFFAPVLIGAVLFLAAHRVIRRDEPRALTDARIDIAGAVTITGGMVVLVYALVSGTEGGLGTSTLVGVAVAAVFVASFVAIERRVATPLVRLRLLREGLLSHAAGAGTLFMGAFFGFQFALTLYLQELRGWSPLEVGLTFTVMGSDLVLAPLLTPRLVRRFGTVAVMTAGFVVATVAYALALRLDTRWGYLDLFPSLLLVSVAFALVYGPLAAAATEGIDDSEHGVVGGVVNTAFQFGGALGLSAVTTVLLLGDGDDAALVGGDYRRALAVPAAAALLTVVVGLGAIARRRSVLAARSVTRSRQEWLGDAAATVHAARVRGDGGCVSCDGLT